MTLTTRDALRAPDFCTMTLPTAGHPRGSPAQNAHRVVDKALHALPEPRPRRVEAGTDGHERRREGGADRLGRCVGVATVECDAEVCFGSEHLPDAAVGVHRRDDGVGEARGRRIDAEQDHEETLEVPVHVEGVEPRSQSGDFSPGQPVAPEDVACGGTEPRRRFHLEAEVEGEQHFHNVTARGQIRVQSPEHPILDRSPHPGTLGEDPPRLVPGHVGRVGHGRNVCPEACVLLCTAW